MQATDSVTHPRDGAALVSRIVFFCLPLAYCLTFARYWLSDVDEGFLLGNAWRVIHGEIPHRDFIYVRPAVPVLLQAIQLAVLPESLQLIASRMYFYLCVAGYSLAASLLLVRAFGKRAAAIDPYLLASVAFVFSAHDFPPMAWHTTDGVMFSVFGLAVLYGAKRHAGIAAGCVLLVLGALSKQPFYWVAALGPPFAWAIHGRRAGVTAAAWIGAGALATAATLASLGALEPFMTQSTRALGAGGGLFEAGLFAYLDVSFAQCLVALAFGWAASQLARRTGREFDLGIAVGVGLLALFATMLAREAFPIVRRFAALPGIYNPIPLMWLGAGLIAFEAERGRRDLLVLAVLLFVAWSSGITRGSQGPGLFAAPMFFSLMYFASAHLHSRHVRGLLWLAIAGGTVTFSLMYFAWPRGFEPGSAYPTVALESLSPKLSHIRGSPYTFRKYSELFAARARYGDRISVLPGLALAHYLLGTQNPLPVDLVQNPEIAGGEARFFRALDEDVDYILIERIHQRPELNGSVERVESTWTHVETLEAFEVYKNPRLATPEGLARPGGVEPPT